MKAFILLTIGIIIGLACSTQLLSQKRPAYNSRAVRINKKLPTVFIAPEPDEWSRKLKEKSDEVLRWFRLRNNSIWSIQLDASGGKGLLNAGTHKGTQDATLYYELLDKKGNISESHLCHVCSIVNIASGKSILFSLPYDRIADANSFRIAFSYQWEDEIEIAPEIEPKHFVYFYLRP